MQAMPQYSYPSPPWAVAPVLHSGGEAAVVEDSMENLSL